MKPCESFTSAVAELSKDGAQPQLRVVFPEASITSPGVKLSSLPTKATPKLSIASSLVKPHPGDKYVVICLDLDAPFPSFSPLGPIAHAIDFDLVASPADSEGFSLLESKTVSLIPYTGPGPPPPSAPHRYVFMAWEQPEGISTDMVRKQFSIPETPGVMARMRWDQPAFETKLGLGKALAANYFVASSE
jgi:hypothetical protein